MEIEMITGRIAQESRVSKRYTSTPDGDLDLRLQRDPRSS